MDYCLSFCNKNAAGLSSLFQKSVEDNINCHNSPSHWSFPATLTLSTLQNSLPFLSSSCSSSFRLNCYHKDDGQLSTSSAYDVLGVASTCTPAELKAAFRAKVCHLFQIKLIDFQGCLLVFWMLWLFRYMGYCVFFVDTG